MNSFYPYYVGVSRSGCHWLRIVLEAYLDGKSPLSNYFATQHETIHEMYKRVEQGEFPGTHDLDLKFQSRHVIYLYRNPVDCIFSNLKYDGTPIGNVDAVNYYLDIWIRHIQKWVFDEDFTEEKVILCYDRLSCDFVGEFAKLLNFMGILIHEAKLLGAREKFTREKIREIIHDKKVINIEPDYQEQRLKFSQSLGPYIFNKLPQSHRDLFDESIIPYHLQKIWYAKAE